jgi:hypothetical protein
VVGNGAQPAAQHEPDVDRRISDAGPDEGSGLFAFAAHREPFRELLST